LPATFKGAMVYHILGDYKTLPDYAIWEEDYMEFVCGLLENRDTLENLFRVLASRDLLLLGAPSEDWIVRFFLRAAHGKRLSERTQRRDYLADSRERLGEPMIFFFDKAVRATRIIDGPPDEFVRELTRRWREAYARPVDIEEFVKRQPESMPRGSVFVSYSHNDLKAAVHLSQALDAAGVPVWLDKQRLKVGENYESSLEHAVKDESSFFVSLISTFTEGDPNGYVHKERTWAAQRHVDGFVFYIPLVIDDLSDIRLEPTCFHKIHYHRLADNNLAAFVQRVRHYVDLYRDSGRPRG
jgi:hypothetical protein